MALLDMHVHPRLLLFAKWSLEEKSDLIAGYGTTSIFRCVTHLYCNNSIQQEAIYQKKIQLVLEHLVCFGPDFIGASH